ncbi:hypothetical protein PR048_015660 [Dryococelus australis]|uniref:Uncharacterized protein n=1 Tax=Dryococelus australis TaxID=614101 RepID=A0ABQ9HHQ6_9NEOP|nr:hypothetical protein PR048_015660 [Dryococelus australis]
MEGHICATWLTASNFGTVCKRHTATASLVKKILFVQPPSSAAIQHGISSEEVALKEYETTHEVWLFRIFKKSLACCFTRRSCWGQRDCRGEMSVRGKRSYSEPGCQEPHESIILLHL